VVRLVRRLCRLCRLRRSRKWNSPEVRGDIDERTGVDDRARDEPVGMESVEGGCSGGVWVVERGRSGLDWTCLQRGKLRSNLLPERAMVWTEN
jgi:hypothetical protein